MISALESALSGPGLGFTCSHCVVFLGKTLCVILLQCFSPPKCING